MIHESSECRNTNLTSFKEKTLLSKYDIPIDHLSYEYIEKCNVVKELERIIRILRSGEEGLYPDLIKKAEEKLRLISPNSRLLTIEEPALTKYTMEQEDWNGTMDDIKVWIDEMKVKDGELSEVNNITKTENLKYPPVRKDTTKQKPPPTNSEAKVINKKIPSSDYTGWEKYDADTEVLKLDLEEERRIQERKKNEKKKEDESVRLDDVIKQSEQLSEVEKKYLAEQEKNRGNEYFKSRDYNEAIKYYSASIAILPTAVAHNNRAMCYLKMCKYTAALEDTNVAIELDPNNIKAYYRRGLALQHKNQFQKALADMDKVLEKEPNHAVARHIANDLREQCLSLPKKIRLLMEDKDPVTGRRRKKIILVSEEEYKSDPKLQNGIEVNEWGLPKTMCKCNGVPSFVRLTTYPPKIAEHILVRDPNQIANIQSSESAVSSTESKIVELDREENNGNYYSGDEKTDRPKRLEIMEVDNIEDECCGDRTNKSSRSNFNVVDMRGKEGGEIVKSVNNDIYKSGAIPKTKMVNGDIGGKEGGDKVNSVYSNDVYKSGAIPKTKMVNGDYYVHSKAVKLNSNITSKEQNDSAEIDKFYRKPPNVVPNKYKNIIRDHSEYGDVPENEETSEIGNRVSSNASVKVSPYQFNSMWISRRPHDLEKQADILRRVQPSELPSLIGNKLDEKMMTSILRCLKLKFDLRIEKELVRDYLIALTNCERFNFIVTFLSPKESNVVRELVDGLKPDDSMTQLMEDFCLIDDNQAAKNLTLCL